MSEGMGNWIENREYFRESRILRDDSDPVESILEGAILDSESDDSYTIYDNAGNCKSQLNEIITINIEYGKKIDQLTTVEEQRLAEYALELRNAVIKELKNR